MIDQKFNKAELIALLLAYTPIDQSDLSARDDILSFVNQCDNFYHRSQLKGHVTASAWVVDQDQEYVLLTHHAKLGRWMQLGGHIEDDPGIHAAALREANEESGLTSVKLLSQPIFDLDIHEIPQSTKAPAHLHYDIRFLFSAKRSEPLRITAESNSLEWFIVENVALLTSERSVLRMVEKSLRRSKHNLP